MASKIYKLLWLVSLMATVSVHARILITGDSAAAPATSFSFTVSEHALVSDVRGVDRFYVGQLSDYDPDAPVTTQQYSLSGYNVGTAAFAPMAPATITLNKETDQVNPMCGQPIQTLGIFGGTPACVLVNSPQNLYWVISTAGATRINAAVLNDVLDAQGASGTNGQITSGILKLQEVNGALTAAVAVNGGSWGSVGSGVALIQQSDGALIQLPGVAGDTGIKSAPFDSTSPCVTAGATTPVIGADSIVDMFWDAQLQRLYLTYEVSATSDVSQVGVRAVSMGYIGTASTWNFVDFLPGAGVLTASSSIVGAYAATGTVQAQICMFRTMHSSTRLSYAIVLGNATGASVQSTVYALPLTDLRLLDAASQSWRTDPNHGAVASKIINPGTNPAVYWDTLATPTIFQGREFETPAAITADITVNTDLAAMVGGGAAPGIVNDMVICNDSVFVAVSDNSTDVNGIYYSQALFDSNGVVKGWTAWQKTMSCATAGNQVYGIGYSSYGRFVNLQGTSPTTINTGEVTTWSNGGNDGLFGGVIGNQSSALTNLINNTFASTGGVQGFFDFPRQSLIFDGPFGASNHLSYMIATGNQQVLIAETGNNSSGQFAYINNYTANPIGINGAADAPNSALLYNNQNPVIASLGAITSAEFFPASYAGESNWFGYLFIGGQGGLAAIGDWAIISVGYQFAGFGTPAVTALGNYTNVKKIFYDGNASTAGNGGYLYVLTPYTLDRLYLGTAGLLSELTYTTVATPTSMGLPTGAAFSDVVASNKMALLGTTVGVYRVGNGANITTATDTADVNWTPITFAQGAVPVVGFQVLSPTVFEYSFSGNTTGGNINVLMGTVGLNSSCVYRLTVTDTSTAAITNNTVQQIPDYTIQAYISPFAFLNEYKNSFYTTGSLFLMTRSQNAQENPSMQAIYRTFVAGTFLNARPTSNYIATIPLVSFPSPTQLLQPVLSSAFGTLVVPTNGQIQVLE